MSHVECQVSGVTCHKLANKATAREKIANMKQKSVNNNTEAEVRRRERQVRDEYSRDSHTNAGQKYTSNPPPTVVKTSSGHNITKNGSPKSKGFLQKGGTFQQF